MLTIALLEEQLWPLVSITEGAGGKVFRLPCLPPSQRNGGGTQGQ